MFEDRPWLAQYAEGVPADVEVPPVRIGDLLIAAAERHPDRIALDFFGATMTYAELVAQSARAQAVLTALGVKPGDTVSLVLPNSTSHVVAFHAVLACGATVVEHNPTYTTAELHDQFNLVSPVVALVWRNRVPDVVEAAKGTSVTQVVAVDLALDLPRTMQVAMRLPIKAVRERRAALTGADIGDLPQWHRLLRAATARALTPVGEPSDIALIIFTGGTTGTPKAATLTHTNLVANAVQGQAWANFDDGQEVVYGMLPFFHAFGMVFCLILPPLIAATVVTFPNFDPPSVIKTQKRRPATFVPGVAPMFPRLLDAAAGADLSTIKLAFSGAMPLPAPVAERWEQATGGLLIEGYGMTECSPIALGNPCSTARRRGSLGIPFPSTQMRIVDQDHPEQEAAVREDGTVRGELCVRGPQVFAGYLDNPEETAAMIDADGWLHTGDVVEVGSSGFAVLVDRVKEMIVVGGFKVFPSAVESYLREMPEIADVAVVGIPRAGSGDEEVVAVVVPGDGDLSLDALREYGATRLPHYALPRHLHTVDALPVSMIGKTLRRVVRADYLKHQHPDA